MKVSFPATITIDYTPQARVKRQAGNTYAAQWSSCLEQKASIIKTACSCIQTPSTKIVQTTPKVTVKATFVSPIRATTMTRATSITTDVNAVVETIQLWATATLLDPVVCPSHSPAFCAALSNCVNTNDDPANCGACGNACGSDQHCSGDFCLSDSCSEIRTCG